MVRLCECGCGQPAPIAKKNDKSSGRTEGRPQRFIHGHNLKKGKKNRNIEGRLMVYCYKHPKSNRRGYVPNYILVAEKALGKYLPNDAVVHHVDGNPANDSNNNLTICENVAYHNFLHRCQRAFHACGHARWRKCIFCQQYDDPKNLYIKENQYGCHRKCQNEYNKKWRKSESC